MKINAYKNLEKNYRKISLIYEAMSILGWDKATFMPELSIDSRTDQLTNLYILSHNMMREKKFFKMILDSEKIGNLNKWQKKNLSEIKKEYLLNNALDEELLKKISQTTSKCEMLWRKARKENNFKSLIPILSEVVRLKKKEAKIKSRVLKCGVYDALLNDYESGLKSETIDKTFNQLLNFLPDLITEILLFQKKNKKIMHIKDKIDINLQEKLGKILMEKIGFDFSYGRLDVSMHPFCGGTYQDSRITTRYNEKNFIESLMGVLHETGHALYNLGLPKDWKYQPVGDALGTVVHESQSLFMEMQVCRSLEFLKFASPIIKKIFKRNGKEWNYLNLYNIYTQVTPSLIRVDADEATYPLHIIIRYKIEKLLIEDNLSVKQIPEIWNKLMKKYLGIVPRSNTEGCLQDIHWFDGTFGYFPTYTFGALYASQLFSSAKRKIPGLKKNIEKGNFTSLIKWLRKNIHNHGSLYNNNELIKKITGEDLNIDYFKNHLIERYLN